MVKKKRIFLIVFLVILLVAFLAVYLNRDLIFAIKDGVSYDSETLEKMAEENRIKTDEVLKSVGIETVNPLTSEEIEKLQNGEITAEEAAEKIVGVSNAPAGNSNGSGDVAPSTPQTGDSSDEDTKIREADRKIAVLVGKIYVLKAEFESELSGLESQIISQYTSLPEEERTYSSKVKLGRSALSQANSLEANCDSQMEAILTELKTELVAAQRDASLISSIRSAYEEEKKIKKSYYLSKYL